MLTATYPLGHLPYGWLNRLKPVSPAFQKVIMYNRVVALFLTDSRYTLANAHKLRNIQVETGLLFLERRLAYSVSPVL